MEVVVIGAGPAGLTAAHALTAREVPAVVYEQDGQVGGIARTVEYKGFRFDLGGHRFFTKQPLIRNLWQSLLGDELLTRPRLSRIYFEGRFYDYPLKPLNVLRNLGVSTSLRAIGSYLRRKVRPITPETSFADWVTNRFGDCLFELFFRAYTEKVWGVPCTAIGAQWAAQRIRGLSLRTAVQNMFAPRRAGTIRSLVEEFLYPRLGPGQMWEALEERIRAQGGTVCLDSRVTGIHHDGSKITALEVGRAGGRDLRRVDAVISTMPLRHLITAFQPEPPVAVVAAALRLKYRDFLTVALIVDAAELFPDNWLYIHDPSLRVGRVQNYKNWSPAMVPDPSLTCVGMEYFCRAGDDLWRMDDDGLVDLATRELERIGIAEGGLVREGVVVRMPKAYPIYDEGFDAALATIREYLERFGNLQVVGRNGMHRYNNMDHSMLTAELAVRNLFGERHDLWGVNADDDYHELQSDFTAGAAGGVDDP
ncbi:MAG: NAD(P)-binding protein [Geobacter sp.]|nr:NAD(P)-binding protein [Geobacter sp.]